MQVAVALDVTVWACSPSSVSARFRFSTLAPDVTVFPSSMLSVDAFSVPLPTDTAPPNTLPETPMTVPGVVEIRRGRAVDTEGRRPDG